MSYRLQNNGFTISTFNKFMTYLSADNCPIVNLFVDWNPVYTDDFKAGDRYALDNQPLYTVPEDSEELSPWARL